jgi:hypothetical protein
LTKIFIISGTTWTVPSDWNFSSYAIEVIGGGGGGGTSSGGNDAGGGGGGGYSKITNLTGLTAGGSVTVQVGTGGTASTIGGQTWFNGANASAALVSVNGGAGSTGTAGGAGGTVINGTGFSGGAGGSSNNSQAGGAGGGGAAGPNGAGTAGGPSGLNVGSGGGGAGGGSATAGSDGSIEIGGAGGDGQEGHATAPGGEGGRPSANAQAGARGSGGGGGGSGYFALSDEDGGAGGLYGGGGGSTGYGPGTGVGGTGGQGIIVITYAPVTSITVTADAWAPPEFQATACRDNPDSIQFLAATRIDMPVPAEALRSIWHDLVKPIELVGAARGSTGVSAEWAGTLAVTADAPLRLECTKFLRSDTTGLTEFAISVLHDAYGATEWLRDLIGDAVAPIEILSILRRNAPSVFESLTSGTRVSVGGLATLEWADPPAPMLVSPERLLRSPGRIRILAGAGSSHPLRGQ